MKFTATLSSLFLLASMGTFTSQAGAAQESKHSQTITRAGTQSSIKGLPEFFTGKPILPGW